MRRRPEEEQSEHLQGQIEVRRSYIVSRVLGVSVPRMDMVGGGLLYAIEPERNVIGPGWWRHYFVQDVAGESSQLADRVTRTQGRRRVQRGEAGVGAGRHGHALIHCRFQGTNNNIVNNNNSIKIRLNLIKITLLLKKKVF